MEVRSEQDKQKLFPHTQLNFFSGIISWRVRGVRLPAPLRESAHSSVLPSYKAIGAATGMSVNMVRKHICCALADKGLIST